MISEGTIKFLETGCEKVLAYERRLGEVHLVVLCNFSGEEQTVKGLEYHGEVLIGNYSGSHKMMQPYEAMVLIVR